MKSTGALIVIAAMLMTPIALVLSGTVGAAHSASISVTPVKVRGGENVILSFTVTNDGTSAHAITKVRITLPSGWSNPAALVSIPKDNRVKTFPGGDNEYVVLPAGSAIILMENENIFLPENTVVIVKENKYVYYPNNNGQTRLQEDIEVWIAKPGGVYTENVKDENFTVVNNTPFRIGAGKEVILDQDVLAIRVSSNAVKLPENIWVRLTENYENNLEDNNVALGRDLTVRIPFDNHVRLKTSRPRNSMNWSMLTGDDLELTDNEIIIPAGTKVQLTASSGIALVKALENTKVIKSKNTLVDVSTATPENVPKDWSATVSASYIEWSGGSIAPGASEVFKLAATSAPSSADYTFRVTTTDTANLSREWSIKVTVDSTPPVLSLEVSKSWVGGEENVTITVKGNEPFTFDNVEIFENGMAPRLLSLTPNDDNTQWTGVYTTENADYWENDGYITVRVNRAKDELGNENTLAVFGDKIFVDRRKPAAPSLTGIGLSVGIENKNYYVVNVYLTSTDDNLVFTPADYTPAGMVLEIYVDNELVKSENASESGLVSFDLTIPDGKHVIKARIIDKAGNIGRENSDNLFIDTQAPSVAIEVEENVSGESISSGGYANENVLAIRVTLSDAVLGIENKANWALYENENLDNGYIVVVKAIENFGPLPASEFQLTPEVLPVVENIENVVPNVFLSYVFDNILRLPEGVYEIVAIAGDGMHAVQGKGIQRAEARLRFTVDVTPPAAPVLTTAQYVGTTKESPERSRRYSYTIAGTAEAGATVRVLANVYNFKTGQSEQSNVVLGSTQVGADNRWTLIVSVSDYQGKVVEVLTETIDVAGNVSRSRTTYGYLMYDGSAPRVTIDSKYKDMKTGEGSVVVEGTIQIDDWETYADITVTTSPAGTSIHVDPATGRFRATIPLQEGKNQIVVTATDIVGNLGSDSAMITKTVTPWAMYAIVIVIIALILAAIAIFRRA
jgi:hypothetical protein